MSGIIDAKFMHEVRAAILKELYEYNKKYPGLAMGEDELQEKLGLSFEDLRFHLYYLEDKDFIRISGGGMHVMSVAITALGIDAVENPEMFVKDAPFLQQIIIQGNVINSTIMQAESIKIRNGLNRIVEQVPDPEIRNLIQELIEESYKEELDASKVRSIWKVIKEKAPDIATKVYPYVMKLLEKWLDSS